MTLPSSNKTLLVIALAAGVFTMQSCLASSKPVALPSPKVDTPLSATPGAQTAVLAGGCFWGLEAVFEHVNGVKDVTSGYAGGSAATARYGIVGGGRSGHAEAVKIVYDPAKVSYGQLLKVYFSVAHDPTELNRQGPDSGSQYRSAIFAGNAEQAKVAKAYVAQLDAAHVFGKPIVTQLNGATAFFPAESYHQDYARHNPNDPYIVINDAPKVVHLKQLFPTLYRGG